MTSSMASFSSLLLALTGFLLIKWTFQALHSGAAEQARQHRVLNKHHSNCGQVMEDTMYFVSNKARGVCTGRGYKSSDCNMQGR